MPQVLEENPEYRARVRRSGRRWIKVGSGDYLEVKRIRCNTIVLRFIVKYWIWNFIQDGEYGSGIFELEYGSNYGRNTVGYTDRDIPLV